ncbi:hypothetical protein B0D71_02405 [Pseudomonas laurylsulfativorans]|uniref:Uncharacterized protein n=1 Tax=Pseudomonas laurylsulfativorans TaxID=1943631 RepID=A0A2S3VUT4_9PSED|nr:hypothetical protein B0D71_02405 [Pseudomonas laurylsulfativorans]
MVVNDNAGSLIPRGTLGFFASRLAPTLDRITHVGAGLPAKAFEHAPKKRGDQHGRPFFSIAFSESSQVHQNNLAVLNGRHP